MSHTSDFVVSITKELHDKSIAMGNMPSIIERATPRWTAEKYVLWSLPNLKWVETLDEIRELIQWLDWCKSEQENPPEIGAMRLNQSSSDIQTWGSPWDFGIETKLDFAHPAD